MTRRSGWMLPVAALALLPKCPACIAAYIAVATGFTMSFSAAAALRTSVILLSGIALLLIVVRRLTTAKSMRRSCACQPHEAAK